MTVAVGIDLGTTYTLVATVQDGRPRIIPNAEGQRLTPSVVAFTRDGKPLVGQPARRQAAANPEGTIFSIKRRMGSSFKVRLGSREYTPQELSALILRKVRADAEDCLGQKIDRAVITVPAYFNDRQRQATREAGMLAGLEVMRIINEPTAAALAYGLDREGIHTVLVWDLGGGTFDVSVLELEKGIFEVRAVSGDTWLGGDDWDQRVAEYLAEQFRNSYGVDLTGDGAARQRLREAAERAKIELSTGTPVTICLPLIGRDRDTTVQLKAMLSREQLQELTRDLLERMIPPTRQALADAGLEPRDLHRVLLVGGATRMPAVWGLARELLGKEPYQSLNPDEAVALGAAIQAGMLLGMIDKAVLLDVPPLSLGVETQGGLFTRVIHRNTPLPARESCLFTTARDNQTSVDIQVLQGEREIARDDLSLGEFQLNSIPPLPRGVPRIEVGFQVDVDAIVHVSATDLLTGSEVGVQLVSTQGIPPEDIQHLIEEAEFSAGADRERRERIEANIRAENALAAAERAVKELAAQGDIGLGPLLQAQWRLEEALAGGAVPQIKLACVQLREALASLAGRVAPAPPPGLRAPENSDQGLFIKGSPKGALPLRSLSLPLSLEGEGE